MAKAPGPYYEYLWSASWSCSSSWPCWFPPKLQNMLASKEATEPQAHRVGLFFVFLLLFATICGFSFITGFRLFRQAQTPSSKDSALFIPIFQTRFHFLVLQQEGCFGIVCRSILFHLDSCGWCDCRCWCSSCWFLVQMRHSQSSYRFLDDQCFERQGFPIGEFLLCFICRVVIFANALLQVKRKVLTNLLCL
jgi:hypothetical protein